MRLDEILSKFKNVRKNGKDFTALCQAHNDTKNSLSISETSDKIILHCHAGCSANEICKAVGIEIKDLFFAPNENGNNGNKTSQSKIIEVYQYKDEQDNLIYENVRFEPKDFRQRHYGKDGKEVWNLQAVRRVPYRLPELITALRKNPNETVFLTEGEKDCDNLRGLGLTASSFKNWKSECNQFIKNSNVILLTDHDQSGIKQAEAAIKIIQPIVKTIKLIDLFESEDLPEKHGKDISDWLTLGHSKAELEKIVTDSHFYQLKTFENDNGRLKPLKAVKLSEVETKPIEWLWKPLLAVGTFNLLEGEEGIGKTFLTCALASAVASGKGLPFISANEHLRPSNVLLISAEDSLSHTLKPRLEMMNAACERIIAIEEGFTLDRDGILRLSMVLAEYEPKLVIIDPLFSYTGKINLNSDNEIRSITDELKRLAEKYQCVILGIRHIGKSKGFGDARNAGLNGIGWRASARSVLLIGKNPENESQKALCQTKTNLGEKFTKSIGFEIKDGQFFWTGESTLTKETMLSSMRNETGEERSERQDAIEFLRESLSDGEKWSKDILAEAKQIGISERTLLRAKSVVNIQSRKEGYKPTKWFWKLPEDSLINEVGNLRANQEYKTSYSNDLAEDCQANTFDNLQSKNGSLPKSEEKNKSPKCFNCGLKMDLIENGSLWFCSMGCGSRKA